MSSTEGDCDFGLIDDYDVARAQLNDTLGCQVTTRNHHACGIQQSLSCTGLQGVPLQLQLSFDVEWDSRRGFWAGTADVEAVATETGTSCSSSGFIVALSR